MADMLHIERSGGFANITARRSVELAKLPGAMKEKLHRLMTGKGGAKAGGAADMPVYHLRRTKENGETEEMRVSEAEVGPEMQELLDDLMSGET